MLDEEHAKEIKRQLIQNIKETFPEDKKDKAISHLEDLNAEELEDFLIKNNLIKNPDSSSKLLKESQCIFCSIVEGYVNSYKIDENKDSIAILEINPVSKGHVLIVPKKHLNSTDKLPQSAFTLAKKLAKKIQEKIKPKEVKISSSNFMGHEIINVFPLYNTESLESDRQQASVKQLEELKTLLVKKQKASKPKKEKKQKKDLVKQENKPEKKLWLPRRIP